MSALSKLPVVAESLVSQLKLELTIYFSCIFRGDRYFALRINGRQLCSPSISLPHENEGEDALSFFSHTFSGIQIENFQPTGIYFDSEDVRHCPILAELPMQARDKIPVVGKVWMDKAGSLVWISESVIKILHQDEDETSFMNFNPAGLVYPEGLSLSCVLREDINRGRIIA